MTLTTTVVPSFVNPPKAGKREGSIKVADGSYYGVPPALLSNFQAGNSYTVEYTEKQGTGQWAGKVFRSITRIAATEQAKPEQAAAQQSGGGTRYGATDDKTAERIFCCGALNAAIQSGNVVLGKPELITLVNDLRAVWANTFGGKPQAADDIGDQVPF